MNDAGVRWLLRAVALFFFAFFAMAAVQEREAAKQQVKIEPSPVLWEGACDCCGGVDHISERLLSTRGGHASVERFAHCVSGVKK